MSTLRTLVPTLARSLALAAVATGCLPALAPAEAAAEHAMASAGFVRVGAQQLAAPSTFASLRIADEARYRQLVLVVEGGAVALRDLAVTFADGATFAPGTRRDFAADSQSRRITLPRGPRALHRVDVDVARLRPGAQVALEVWAR